MASQNTSSALTKRHKTDIALMPPPPLKRIKRPSKVLDEDDYTSALSDIIARDYFPGLLETQAQEEYLTALESNNEAWIAEAGQKLRETMTPLPAGKSRRIARNTRFDTPSATPRPRAADTPQGYTGSETPLSTTGNEASEAATQRPSVDTSALSLSAFQAKYTSEDNASFNDLLDERNAVRRQKHAYLWSPDQRIPSKGLIAHRVREQRLLKEAEENPADTKALVPLTTGAIASRPAQPGSWTSTRPDNTFMFHASSIDEDGLPTTFETLEASSKAGPRHVVHANTRFQPVEYVDDPGPVPPSPSLNTTIIARRDAARASSNAPSTMGPGSETPRVNGYSFVDEDEPSAALPPQPSLPSYRDLLAGQAGDGMPNPFKISSMRKREDLHHRLVEQDAAKKRTKERETIPNGSSVPSTPIGGKTPLHSGNMTPAARKLMEKLGRTPVRQKDERMSSREMWTPGTTPRRKAVN